MLLAVDADEDRLVGATLNNVITAEDRDTWSWPRHANTEYARLVFGFTEELGVSAGGSGGGRSEEFECRPRRVWVSEGSGWGPE